MTENIKITYSVLGCYTM